jgi:hypothetical protein
MREVSQVGCNLIQGKYVIDASGCDCRAGHSELLRGCLILGDHYATHRLDQLGSGRAVVIAPGEDDYYCSFFTADSHRSEEDIPRGADVANTPRLAQGECAIRIHHNVLVGRSDKHPARVQVVPFLGFLDPQLGVPCQDLS